jgi:hypothetical protein
MTRGTTTRSKDPREREGGERGAGRRRAWRSGWPRTVLKERPRSGQGGAAGRVAADM